MNGLREREQKRIVQVHIMPDLRGFIANNLVGANTLRNTNGCPVLEYDPSFIKVLEWRLNHYQIELYQHQDILTHKPREYTKKFIRSTQIIVKNVPQKHLKKGKQILHDLSALLSFASLSYVWCYAAEYPVKSGCGEGEVAWGTAQYVRPTIDICDMEVVQQFIEQTWPAYQRLKKKRRLELVFRYLSEAGKTEQPMEVRLLLTFTALESLKDTFARAQKIPYVKGFYRKVSNPPKTNRAKEPRYSFEALLKLMLHEQSIRKGLKRSIQLRNNIIHSGMSRRPMRSLMKIHQECDELITVYLLKLLQYKGRYLSRTDLDHKKVR